MSKSTLELQEKGAATLGGQSLDRSGAAEGGCRGRVLTYKAAGVDSDAAQEAIRRFAPLVHKTHGPGVLTEIGHFGGVYGLSLGGVADPLLVSGTDGVGSKLRVAFALGRHDTVGVDLVAMSVNDITCLGAQPLFFLDYIGTHCVAHCPLTDILKGIADGCAQAGCALIGGEIAELPEFYHPGEYDLAGFAVGLVDRSRLVDGSSVKIGDAVIGLASSGLHANGYTLARRVLLEQEGLTLTDTFPGLARTVGEELLEPTRIYVGQIRALLDAGVPVNGVAHITSDGFYGNIGRILPEGLGADIYTDSWWPMTVFEVIQQRGEIAFEEMHRTFNMGIGMVVVVPDEEQERALQLVRDTGCMAWSIGEIIGARAEDRKVILHE